MRKKIVVTLVMLIVLLVSAGAISAQEPVSGKDLIPKGAEVVVQPELSRADQLAALAYWTPERLQSQQPVAIPVDYTSSAADVSALSEAPIAEGPRGFAAAGQPKGNADAIARRDYPEAWAAIDAAQRELDQRASQYALLKNEPASLTGTSQQFDGWFNTSSTVANMYPHRWEGRFSSSGGYCSASAISNNHVLTAAHCVYDTGTNKWFSSMVFTPAYRNGSAPYGSFAASGCVILTAWVNLSGGYNINTWARHDVAVCNAGLNSAGKTLNTMVGWMGREWNYDYNRHLFIMGHPFKNYTGATITNAGKYQYVCAAEAFYRATDVRGAGCDMANGMSGGPWMTGYKLNAVNGWATGVTSGVIYGQKNLYGARFSSSNIIPICNATGC